MADKVAATLYVEASEMRQDSNLPFGLATHPRAVTITGLELHTGADMMVTPDGVTITLEQNIISKPKLMVRRITEKSYLFQRKTGMDLLGSIPDLASILKRMLDASPNKPWLVVVGEFERTADGHVAVSYRNKRRESKFAWNALQGALASWQDFGGGVMLCRTDQDLEWFMEQRMSADRIAKIEAGKQVLRPTAPIGISAFVDQSKVLCGLPGVGQVLADRIMHYCGGNLAQALAYVSGPLTEPLRPVEVEGVGDRTREEWREVLGLEGDDHMIVVKEAEWLKMTTPPA